MYRIGALVVHPDYGLGSFQGIHGEVIRIALVHFRGRGIRRIILPSPRLRACRALGVMRPGSLTGRPFPRATR